MNAKAILLRAIECDIAGRILEAGHLYYDGVNILLNWVIDEPDENKKRFCYESLKEHIARAEHIKRRVQRCMETSVMVANIPIENGCTGHSYNSLLGKYLTAEVKEILLEEPYLLDRCQLQNLIAFFELAVKNCSSLKYIRLVTKEDAKNPSNQISNLRQIKEDLSKRDITLSIKFEPSLHDRKIILSSGYIIKIGRGLHFFKPTNPLYSLGLCDYDFRKCLQTDVDIWRTKNLS